MLERVRSHPVETVGSPLTLWAAMQPVARQGDGCFVVGASSYQLGIGPYCWMPQAAAEAIDSAFDVTDCAQGRTFRSSRN